MVIAFSSLFLNIKTPAQQAADPYIINFGTVANSVDETGYFHFGRYAQKLGFTAIDSIQISLFVEGEIDIDSLDCYLGVEGVNTNVADDAYTATALTYTVTLNVAAAAEGVERLLVDNATLLTSAAIRGYNSVKIITRGATAGNDATDPNKLWVMFFIYGKKT